MKKKKKPSRPRTPLRQERREEWVEFQAQLPRSMMDTINNIASQKLIGDTPGEVVNHLLRTYLFQVLYPAQIAAAKAKEAK